MRQIEVDAKELHFGYISVYFVFLELSRVDCPFESIVVIEPHVQTVSYSGYESFWRYNGKYFMLHFFVVEIVNVYQYVLG